MVGIGRRRTEEPVIGVQRDAVRSGPEKGPRFAASLLAYTLLAATALFSAGTSVAANLTVDGSSTFQVVDGMGVNLNVHGWVADPFPEVIDLLVDQNGTSLVRVIRDPMDWVSSASLLPALRNLDPATLAQVYETEAMRDLWGAIAYLNQKGIRGPQIVLNFMGWTPTWLGGSGQFNVPSYLAAGREADFATVVASLVYYGRRVRNLDFTLLSPTNENDWNGLEGPNIGPYQYTLFLTALVADLDRMGLQDVRLVSPDTAGEPNAWLPGILNTPSVNARVDHIAFHKYGGSTTPGTAYSGKNYWMTETGPSCPACDSNGTPTEGEWPFSVKMGDLILGDLANGFAAVLIYESHDCFYYHHDAWSHWGLIGLDGTTYFPRKRFFVNAQMNRFIRPGARRVAVNESISGVGTTIAFQDAAGGTFTIAGHVTSSSPVTITGQLNNLPFTVPLLRNYQTSATVDMQRGADVVVSGGAFSVTIPGETFFTLAFGDNTAPVATIVAPVDQGFYYPGQTIALSGGATDAQTPPDSLDYHWVVDLVSAAGIQPGGATFTGRTASYASPMAAEGTGVRQRIRMTATDPQGIVSDTAEVTLWPEVDLVVSGFAVSPAAPVVGQNAYCTFRVSNAGRMGAPASRWEVRAGNVVLASGDMAVSASGYMDMVQNLAFTTTGSLLLRVTVDSLGALRETNEANNSMARAVTVGQVPGNVQPVAVVSAAPTAGAAPFVVSFSGAASTDADGDSLMYEWTFGDGTAGVGRLVTHTYAAGGGFAAILTVVDGRGGSDTASVAISVSGSPGAVFPQTPVLDTFNAANGILTTPPWTDQNENFVIQSGRLSPGSGDHYTQWSTSFGADQEAYVTLSAIDVAGREQNLMLKTQGTTWNTGHVEVSYDALDSRVAFITFTPPSAWQEVGSVSGITFAAGDRFGARALANGTVKAYRNGIEIGSASIVGWPFAGLGGRIGLSVAGAPAARFEDFGGGTIQPGATTPVGVPAPLSTTRGLSGAFPNPTHAGTVWTLSLPVGDAVSFSVIDLQGREVWSAAPRPYAAGQWPLSWDGRAVPAGLYFARVRVGEQVFLRRVAVMH